MTRHLVTTGLFSQTLMPLTITRVNRERLLPAIKGRSTISGEVDGPGKFSSDANMSLPGNSHVSDEYFYLLLIATIPHCGKESWRRRRVRPRKGRKKDPKRCFVSIHRIFSWRKRIAGFEGFIEMTGSKLSMLRDYLSNQYAGRFPETVQDGTQVIKQYVQAFDSDTAKTFAEDLKLCHLPSTWQPCPRCEIDLVLYLSTHLFPSNRSCGTHLV